MDFIQDLSPFDSDPKYLKFAATVLSVIVAVLFVVTQKRSYVISGHQEVTRPPTADETRALHWDYSKLRDLVRRTGLSLPAMLVNLDVVDANVDRVKQVARKTGTSLRIATKSVRSPHLLRHIAARAGSHVIGYMCFSVQEAAMLAEEHDLDDFLVAYPTVQMVDVKAAMHLARAGKTVILTVDSVDHVTTLDNCIAKLCTEASFEEDDDILINVAIDLDMSYYFYGVRLGAHRSDINTLDKFRAVADALGRSKHLRLSGVLGYEASVAGLPDCNPHGPLPGFLLRMLKRRFFQRAIQFRADVTTYCASAGLDLDFFNGGGSGNLEEACSDPNLTEVAIGSAFLQGQLFDYYVSNVCQAAICFALQVTRITSEYICVQSGGFVASGACSLDKFPRPFSCPANVMHYPDEGYGEVQTPLRIMGGRSSDLSLGDPVFFRPAKSGEIAEHFDEYWLVKDYEIIGSCKTYRGLGHAFY